MRIKVEIAELKDRRRWSEWLRRHPGERDPREQEVYLSEEEACQWGFLPTEGAGAH